MTIANVALIDTFDTWRTRTNQLIVLGNQITEGAHNSSGTITVTNTGIALNVTAGSIKVKENVFSSNATTFVSNSATLVISGSGMLGTSVYFNIGELSTRVNDANTGNIASANSVNTVNEFSTAIYRRANVISELLNVSYTHSNSIYNFSNVVFNQLNVAYNTTNSNFGITNSAFGRTNAVYSFANVIFNQLNVTSNVVNTNYILTNSAFRAANTTANVTNLVYTIANQIYSLTNLAFTRANTGGANVGNTAPAGAIQGQLWWNTDYGKLLIYYTDSDSSQWVEAYQANRNWMTVYDEVSSGDSFYPVFSNVTNGITDTLVINTSDLSFIPGTGTMNVKNLIVTGNAEFETITFSNTSGDISFTGNLIVTGTVTGQEFNSVSDMSFKEDIAPIDNALDVIKAMTGVGFNWKNTKKHTYGVVAQDVEKIVPDLVGNINTGEKTVNYDGIIAFLIEAIKELNEKLESKDK